MKIPKTTLLWMTLCAPLVALPLEAAQARPRPVQAQTNKPAWSPAQATGPANVPKAGDDRRAWASQRANAGQEWLELSWARAVKIKRLRIFETLASGAVSKVVAFDAQGDPLTLWEGVAPSKPGIQIFEVVPSSSARSARVRIYLDTTRVAGWNEIDAVELVGTDGSRQWAESAQASSWYAASGPFTKAIGKSVKLTMVSGRTLTGTLESVTSGLLHLTQPGGHTIIARIEQLESIGW